MLTPARQTGLSDVDSRPRLDLRAKSAGWNAENYRMQRSPASGFCETSFSLEMVVVFTAVVGRKCPFENHFSDAIFSALFDVFH
jgi:hypothetical protein